MEKGKQQTESGDHIDENFIKWKVKVSFGMLKMLFPSIRACSDPELEVSDKRTCNFEDSTDSIYRNDNDTERFRTCSMISLWITSHHASVLFPLRRVYYIFFTIRIILYQPHATGIKVPFKYILLHQPSMKTLKNYFYENQIFLMILLNSIFSFFLLARPATFCFLRIPLNRLCLGLGGELSYIIL